METLRIHKSLVGHLKIRKASGEDIQIAFWFVGVLWDIPKLSLDSRLIFCWDRLGSIATNAQNCSVAGKKIEVFDVRLQHLEIPPKHADWGFGFEVLYAQIDQEYCPDRPANVKNIFKSSRMTSHTTVGEKPDLLKFRPRNVPFTTFERGPSIRVHLAASTGRVAKGHFSLTSAIFVSMPRFPAKSPMRSTSSISSGFSSLTGVDGWILLLLSPPLFGVFGLFIRFTPFGDLLLDRAAATNKEDRPWFLWHAYIHIKGDLSCPRVWKGFFSDGPLND